MHRLIK